MATRLGPGEYDQLHHFVAGGVWDATPLEAELLVKAEWLVGGHDAVLVIDDTALPKKGSHSVGVAAQYALRWARRPIARPWSRRRWR
jgi:SRSO17 transposase